MRKTVLVTGATGFVGRNLVAALVRNGDKDVRALVRPKSGRLPNDVRAICGDLTVDDGAAERAVEGCDVVFHCAGAVGDRVTWANGRAVNVEGTRRVARAARTQGVRRFVHVSSVAVYGFDAGTYDEKSPRVTVGEPYIDTKSEGEAVCEAELDGSATTLVGLRPSIIYGPGDTGMLPRMVQFLQDRVPMIGDGSAPVGLVHVTDVVQALLAAAEYEGPQRVFNVTGPDDVSWNDLVARLIDTCGLPAKRTMPRPVAMLLARLMSLLSAMHLVKAPPLTPFTVKFLTEARHYRIDALRDKLGVIPQVGVDGGLARALDALVSQTATHPALAAP